MARGARLHQPGPHRPEMGAGTGQRRTGWSAITRLRDLRLLRLCLRGPEPAARGRGR